MLLARYHDTEVGTNKHIDVYDFVIEMQVMNSDGNLEPVGLQIHNLVWPYVEFTAAQGARVVQTNEHGAVWWSDDIECWGSQDRFPPF